MGLRKRQQSINRTIIGAQINHQDHEGNTVLHECLQKGYEEEIDLCLKGDVRVNLMNHHGLTPLMIAAIFGRAPLKMLQSLVDKGVDWTLTNSKGETALDLAIKYGHEDVFYELKCQQEKSSLNHCLHKDPQNQAESFKKTLRL